MNSHPDSDKLLGWLLTHSLQAGALVLLVLAVQWVFRRQLTNRWRFALWWIVLARLLLPFSPESAMSLFNYVRPPEAFQQPHPVIPPSPASAVVIPAHSQGIPANVAALDDVVPAVIPAVNSGGTPVTPSLPSAARPSAPNATRHSIIQWLVPSAILVWLAGIATLAMIALAQTVRFRSQLTRSARPAGEALKQELERARYLAGISRRIELWETKAVKSPALFGLWRLRLLLPRGLEGKFTPRELHYIFLHELAHVKRGDLWLNWLVTGLQILHWFNPLVWLGFARLRADRELACDELALVFAGDQSGTSYGETVVKLLENLNRPTAVPGLMGILEDKHQMRRRIVTIARFRPPSRWSVLAVILVAVVAVVSLTDAQSGKSSHPYSQPAVARQNTPPTGDTTNESAARPDLIGVVSAKSGGPLPVLATVFIDTAGPKTGTSTFCPSCYADCIKHSPTDAKGNFKIESLDPQLVFKILAVAKGYKPESVSKVDPAKGPVNIKLVPIVSADASPDRSLRGCVVDPQGQPVKNAVVYLQGIESKDGGGMWGTIPDTDPLAVTDDHGEFLLTAKKPFDFMDVSVSARGFADKKFTKLPSRAMNQLKMTEGAVITGRVLKDGRPLAGVSVGVSGVERQSGIYVGHFEIGTDAHGKFTFFNIPPNVDFWIYAGMNSIKQDGAVPIQKIRSGKDGETTEVGDLAAVPAHRLAGHLVLADGQPLPPKVRLLVSREEAWDSMQLTLGKDGSFDTTGIPDELVSLSARVKGYRVSAQNLSLDQLDTFQLIGRMDRDLTNLVFMLEPGPQVQPDYQHMDPEYNEIRERTLQGTEGVRSHAREWSVSGHVIDADTREPVLNFRVTPGEQDYRIGWSTSRSVDGSNGVYLAYFSRRTAQPLLKVEADGYLPQVVNLAAENTTNKDFILKRGSGPAGTVVTPDGTPAAGVNVVLLTGQMDDANFNNAGDLETMGDYSRFRKTGADGKFSFAPVWGAKLLAAAATNGFGFVSLASFATNPAIVLEPLATITGTLRRTSGPGTNETLDLNFTGDDSPNINLWRPADTDDRGHFEFKNVPPARLKISSREKLQNGDGWRDNPLQDVSVKPGQTLAVNIEAADRPAATENSYRPPPMPKLIPGVQLKGVVLGPDGKPAADTEVVLQLPQGPFYMALGRGRFSSDHDLRASGLLVDAAADGSFTLPMRETAASVIAVAEDGYAQVSIEQLKSSPQIRLQKWGRIEGALRVSHHPGTNQTVVLDQPAMRYRLWSSQPGTAGLQPPMLDYNSFRVNTDEQGHFAFSYVPPGLQSIARLVPQGENSWMHSQLDTVTVKPGETTHANIGGTGRTVTGKLKFADDTIFDPGHGYAVITTPNLKVMAKLRQLKTDEERKAFYASDEFQDAMKDYRSYSAHVQLDGTFQAEDVLPGAYDLNYQQHNQPVANATSVTLFTSAQPINVPPAANLNDDSALDLGLIDLKKQVLPIPRNIK